VANERLGRDHVQLILLDLVDERHARLEVPALDLSGITQAECDFGSHVNSLLLMAFKTMLVEVLFSLKREALSRNEIYLKGDLDERSVL
jgi:hypothetical protein